jgi:hypothetical protein
MDRYLAIFGLVLAIAGLVPTFTRTNQNPKGRVISVLASLALLGVFGNELNSYYGEGQLLAQRKEEVQRLFLTNNPLSFEQIFIQLNYRDYASTSSAVDALVDERIIHHRPVEVTSDGGIKYIVRVYNSTNHPIK